jgi:predicted NAD/FAD-dependent oxidoreductase
MSVRRADPFQFDHGAQYMTAHGAAFRGFLAPHLASGLVREWSPRLVRLGADGGAEPCAWTAPRYVAVPGISSLAKAMADGLDVVRETEVSGLDRRDGAWRLRAKDGAGAGSFDWVLLAIPSVQVARLVPEGFADRAALGAVRMRGCFSLMIGLDGPADLPWDAARVAGGPLAWIACDHAKPGRPRATSILCQTTPDWAEANLERPPEEVRADLLAAFARATGIDAAGAPYLRLHRWRFSSTAAPAPKPCLLDPDMRIGAAGDWCGTDRPGRVEAAFDSAEALAEAVRARL